MVVQPLQLWGWALYWPVAFGQTSGANESLQDLLSSPHPQRTELFMTVWIGWSAFVAQSLQMGSVSFLFFWVSCWGSMSDSIIQNPLKTRTTIFSIFSAEKKAPMPGWNRAFDWERGLYRCCSGSWREVEFPKTVFAEKLIDHRSVIDRIISQMKLSYHMFFVATWATTSVAELCLIWGSQAWNVLFHRCDGRIIWMPWSDHTTWRCQHFGGSSNQIPSCCCETTQFLFLRDQWLYILYLDLTIV